MEGLKPIDGFNHRIHYGSMWHVCEKAHSAKVPDRKHGGIDDAWWVYLQQYASKLCKQYSTQQEQVVHWTNVCKTQFPIYVDWWAKHPDVRERTPLLQEQVFDVPYRLPSGRVVRLRGKWDSVDLIGRGKAAAIYLQENKTKGEVDEQQLKRQLSFDLQTVFYLTALQELQNTPPTYAPENDWQVGLWNRRDKGVAGVRYNVVRRPLSGGRGSIVRHKPSKANPRGETSEEFYARLGGLIREDPGYWFMRWRVEITPEDVARFRRECLDPILESLCDWWQKIRAYDDPFAIASNDVHWRLPYGIYNPIAEGRVDAMDEHLSSGSELGLTRTDDLFPELK